jgi:hypothetical protein
MNFMTQGEHVGNVHIQPKVKMTDTFARLYLVGMSLYPQIGFVQILKEKKDE